MSNFRDRARAIREAGEAERANYALPPGGLRHRVYKWWAANTLSTPPTVKNFCHVFWVTVLFAPATWLRVKLSNPVGVTAAVIAWTAVFIWLSLVEDSAVPFFVFIGVPYTLAGMVAAGIYWQDLPAPDRVVRIAVAATAPVAVPTLLLIYAINKFMKFARKNWHDSWTKAFAKLGSAMFAATFVGMVAFVVWIAYSASGWMGIVLLVGIAALSVALFALASWVGEMIAGRRQLKRAEHRKALDAMSYEEFTEYLKNGRRKEPSALRKFFRGAGDFFIFVGQFIRVKKWKFCPIITIPEDNERRV